MRCADAISGAGRAARQVTQAVGWDELLFESMVEIADETAPATLPRYVLEVGMVELSRVEPWSRSTRLIGPSPMEGRMEPGGGVRQRVAGGSGPARCSLSPRTDSPDSVRPVTHGAEPKSAGNGSPVRLRRSRKEPEHHVVPPQLGRTGVPLVSTGAGLRPCPEHPTPRPLRHGIAIARPGLGRKATGHRHRQLSPSIRCATSWHSCVWAVQIMRSRSGRRDGGRQRHSAAHRGLNPWWRPSSARLGRTSAPAAGGARAPCAEGIGEAFGDDVSLQQPEWSKRWLKIDAPGAARLGALMQQAQPMQEVDLSAAGARRRRS